MLVPPFPGWICDVCAKQFYDPEAMFRLRGMLWTGRNNFNMTQAKTHRQDLPSAPDKGELRRRS